MEQPQANDASVNAIADVIKGALGGVGAIYVRPVPYAIVAPEFGITFYCGYSPEKPNKRSITLHDVEAARTVATWIRRGA